MTWSEKPSERARQLHSSVSVVQLSSSGQLLRQNGPDEWLPEASEFMHRLATLVAQGLGFERCASVCLRGATNVLSVAEAGPTRVVAVSGPLRPMCNVLRRAGLE